MTEATRNRPATNSLPELPASTCVAAVLFLDIDGVLNRSGKTRQGLEPEKIELLKRIVETTGCQIVVSSTWRKFEHSRQAILNCLSDFGAVVRGFTPELNHQEPNEGWTPTPRGEEIAAWLKENPDVTHFVILDDDDDLGTLLPHLVQANSVEGLTPDLAAKVIQRLNNVSLP